MDDLNLQIGEGQEDNIIGKHGLGKRNDKGDRLAIFALENNLLNTNIKIQTVYTWQSSVVKSEKAIHNRIDVSEYRCTNGPQFSSRESKVTF